MIGVIGNEMIGNLNHFAYHLKWFITQKKPLILSMIVIVSGKNDLLVMSGGSTGGAAAGRRESARDIN